MRGMITEPVLFFISLLVSSNYRLFHRHATKKVNLKSFNEKGQELGMLCETNLLTASPILRSVRYIVSQLFVEAFHATLWSSVWRRHYQQKTSGIH